MQINGRIVNGADGIRMGCGTRCGRWNGQNGKLDVIGYVQDSPEYPRRRADCTSAYFCCPGFQVRSRHTDAERDAVL